MTTPVELPYTVTTYPSRAKWLEARRGGVGGSDVPILMGLWGSRYQLWADKRGLLEGLERPRPEPPDDDDDDDDQTEEQRFGTLLEPTVAQVYAEDTGRVVEAFPPYTICADREYPWRRVSPDRLILGGGPQPGPGLLECKTTNAFRRAEWQAGAPDGPIFQLQWGAGVLHLLWGSLAVLIGGNRFRYLDADAHERLFKLLAEVVDAFWLSVVEDRPPAVEGTALVAEILTKLHPRPQEQVTITLPVESETWAARLAAIATEAKALETEETLIKNQLRAAIGDAEVGMCPDRQTWWSWKTTQRKEYTVAAREIRSLRIHHAKPAPGRAAQEAV